MEKKCQNSDKFGYSFIKNDMTMNDCKKKAKNKEI